MEQVPEMRVKRWIMRYSNISTERAEELISGKALATAEEKVSIAVGSIIYITKRCCGSWKPLVDPHPHIAFRKRLF